MAFLMSRQSPRLDDLPRGWVTLVLTFVFVLVFRFEQNVAYVLGISARQLVSLDSLRFEVMVHAFSPLLHATPAHLVSTLIWFIPFGYFLECRTRWEDYVGFVVLAGVFSSTLVPAVFVVFGVSEGLAIGASGITFALVGREATARLVAVVQRRSLSQRQRVILVITVLGLLLKSLSFAPSQPANTSVVGHATGLVVGLVAGFGERYVSISNEL